MLLKFSDVAVRLLQELKTVSAETADPVLVVVSAGQIIRINGYGNKQTGILEGFWNGGTVLFFVRDLERSGYVREQADFTAKR